MRRALLVILLLISAVHAQVALAGPARPDPGCAPGWTRVVSHSWWQEKGEPPPGRHIHLGTCFPLHQALTGSSLTLDITVELHNDPGLIKWIRGAIGSDVVAGPYMVNWRCATICTKTFRMTIPFGGYTGWREFRLSANSSSNVFGDRQYQTTRWPARIGSSTSGTPRSGSGGWYHGAYQNAYIDEACARRLEQGPIPSSGLACRAKGDRNRLIVAVDADSHASDPGIELVRTTSRDWRAFTIPGDLPSGFHRLYVRTEHDFSDGMSAGQHEVWFQVP